LPHSYLKLVIADFKVEIGPKIDDCKGIIGNKCPAQELTMGIGCSISAGAMD